MSSSPMSRQPTFLAPEISYFNTAAGSTKDFYVKPNDAHYLLRPETVESLFYLYYFSGILLLLYISFSHIYLNKFS